MKKENLDIEVGPKFCSFCNQPADLMCGRCEEAYYCKPEHQKMDWRRHSSNCKSIDERRREHLQFKRMRKTEIFDYLSKAPEGTSINSHHLPEDISFTKLKIKKAIEVENSLIEKEKNFLSKYCKEDILLEIELGSTVCVKIRLLIASRDLSDAEGTFSGYYKQKKGFIMSTDNISSKQELDQMQASARQHQLYIISGKLKLISTLSNLMHELMRDSVSLFQILINHIEKVFGEDSLELSNIYFYTGNYFQFLTQEKKALACFLKAAKMRKEKGGTAWYNVALLLLRAGRKKRALQFFMKALDYIQKEQNIQNNHIIPQIYENIALIYLEEGMSKIMMDYFQKAYFFYIKHKNKEKAENIMKLFMLMKKDSKEQAPDEMKLIEFAKEKKEKRPFIHITSKNKEKHANADRIADQSQKKTHQWIASFKELKVKYNEPTIFKLPKQTQYLFNQLNHRHGDDEDQNLMPRQSNRLGMEEGLNMDINFMRTLESHQVGYLHELNRLLMECKESAAYFDIVQNSNFYQNVNKEKLNGFYRLNPRLVRPTDLDRRLMLQVTNEEDEDNQEEYEDIIEPLPTPPQPPKTPKLDFSKLKQNKF